VTFHPRDEGKMRKNFNHAGSKRLADMLNNARLRGEREDWIGEQDWATLQSYWTSPAFQTISAQNRRNRASERGGALHTTGRIPHHEVIDTLVSYLILTINISLYI
jgi:hypothetical protein